MTEIRRKRRMSKFGFALLFLLGLLMALKPLWMWKAEKFFKLKDGEPTKTYVKMSRVGGAVISVASFVAMVVSFF